MADAKPTILGLGISMPIIAMIGVALRVQARRIKKVQLGADDYTIFIALVRFFFWTNLYGSTQKTGIKIRDRYSLWRLQ